MPKVVSVPKNLRPYLCHGVNIEWREGVEQATGDCPFCGRSGKFGVNVSNGLWDCKTCRAGNERGGGNAALFLQLLWEESDKVTNSDSYEELRADRKLLYPETLEQWGVCKSIITGDWLVPGYNAEGTLTQLYRYLHDPKSGKRKLIPTNELHHAIHGVNLYDPSKPEVYLCEGPWDALALWEILRCAKYSGKSLAFTANPKVSLLDGADVLAIPGCGAVGEPLIKWLPLLAGKNVILMFDSDQPREVNGRVVGPAGYGATKRAAGLLGDAASVSWLQWGKDGYDAGRPSGWDVRDTISQGETAAQRVALLGHLLEKIVPVPKEWVGTSGGKAGPAGPKELELLPCQDWATLVNAWRKAMRWTPGLDKALSVMLACVTSTKSIGDQLWCKIIGPAACGKSTLCEALSVNKKYVLAKSTIRGFHSGFKSDAAGSEDNSLVAQLYNKTLVTKDGDTLLQSPNLGQILSEARDLYDSTSRTHYRNKMGKDYQGVRMTWILCGTSSLRSIDASELGERFLDCVIMDAIDDDLEDEILWRVANRTERGMAVESDGKLETQHDPDLVKAMQLTGGYVGYLRANAVALLSRVEASESSLRQCIRLGKFVAYMRARPSTKQDESAEREFAARLVSQHIRLAKCLAAVLNRKTLDSAVLGKVKAVALDTARGKTLELARVLHGIGAQGTSLAALAHAVNDTEDKTRSLLRFLRRIGVVENFSEGVKGLAPRTKWKLTERLERLYKSVTEED